MSDSYLAVLRAYHELHRLRAAGQEGSPEADAVRDSADAPWYALTETEKERIGGLSEDLYSITDPPKAAPRDLNPQAQSRLDEAEQAHRHGEWDRALELLRGCAGCIEPSRLSYLRGRIWLGAGDPRTAAIFLEHAVALQPDNSDYLLFLLMAFLRFDPSEAKRRAEPVLEAPSQYNHAAFTQAASVAFGSALQLPPEEVALRYGRLIPILESNLDALEQGGDGGRDRPHIVTICLLLGFAHELMGNKPAAESSYSRGIAADPVNATLLTMRGCLLYGKAPGAIGDLESAIQFGSDLIWPYCFLAHHSLITGAFDRCRGLSERALEMEGPDALKSEVADWLAISQAELGYPADVVRSSFNRAIDFDPTNERARRNRAVFESAVQPVPIDAFETPDTAAIRAMCLSERRLLFQPAA